ncbi:hypothetical protein WN51_12139 [Melipona quadrifasciata]|uniref:Uncharacterized protein n=1 Tax=Melipona quadrifasciata TaxID=166423 RepID=A0A0N0U5Z7_9HYME|nr:hypothetical protein WN51_12139 [Melipona quadrifasciata]
MKNHAITQSLIKDKALKFLYGIVKGFIETKSNHNSNFNACFAVPLFLVEYFIDKIRYSDTEEDIPQSEKFYFGRTAYLWATSCHLLVVHVLLIDCSNFEPTTTSRSRDIPHYMFFEKPPYQENGPSVAYVVTSPQITTVDWWQPHAARIVGQLPIDERGGGRDLIWLDTRRSFGMCQTFHHFLAKRKEQEFANASGGRHLEEIISKP